MIDHDIREIGKEVWVKKFDERMNESIGEMQMLGHCKEKHYNQTDKDLVDRIEHEGKSFVSSFYDEAKIDTYIANALSSNKDKIAEWMLNGKEEDLVLRIPNADVVPVGFGFNSDKEEIITKDIKIVLSPNLDEQNSEFGFIIKTAYADIESVVAQREGRAWKTGYVYNEESARNNNDSSPKNKNINHDEYYIRQGNSGILKSIAMLISKAIKSLAAGLSYIMPYSLGLREFRQYNPKNDSDLKKKDVVIPVKNPSQNQDVREHNHNEEHEIAKDNKTKSEELANDVKNIVKSNIIHCINSEDIGFVKDVFYHTEFFGEDIDSVLDELSDAVSDACKLKYHNTEVCDINTEVEKESGEFKIQVVFADGDCYNKVISFNHEELSSLIQEIDEMIDNDTIDTEVQDEEVMKEDEDIELD